MEDHLLNQDTCAVCQEVIVDHLGDLCDCCYWAQSQENVPNKNLQD